MRFLFKSVFLAVGILSSSFVMADNADEITKISYVCENNKVMEVIYVNTAKDSYEIINQMDEMIPLKIMKMASGANYEAMNKNYTYKLYTKGDNADLVEGKDKPVFSGCKAG